LPISFDGGCHQNVTRKIEHRAWAGFQIIVMKNDDSLNEQPLKEGQLWKIKRRYVLIVALEKWCVRFKLMDGPDQTGERTLTSQCDTLWRYLLSRHGQLV
jgi:hypothetical protein